MLSQRNKRSRGGAVLEMILVLPLLMWVAFGTVEYGYFFYVKHTIQGAAREGCRAGITPTSTNTDVQTAVTGSLFAAGLIASNNYSAVTTKGYTVTISPSNVATVTAGSSITVTVANTWGTVGVRPWGLIGTSKSVAGAAVMRKEG